MGTSLYGNPVIALRELIQNAVDTCRYRKVKEQFWGRPYQPLIEVCLINDGSGDVLEVSDNGMV
jgi:HSP90 family molecular chaperone